MRSLLAHLQRTTFFSSVFIVNSGRAVLLADFIASLPALIISTASSGLFAVEDCVDLAQLFGGEFQVLQRGHIVVDLRNLAGANERAGDARITKNPRYRHFRQRLASFFGDFI